MSDSRTIVLGVDIGTTTTKAVAVDAMTGVVLTQTDARTRWDIGPGGEVQTDIDRLTDGVLAVLETAANQVPNALVVGIGITGMAETGTIVDHLGSALTPAIAWYDQRGKKELAALPTEFHEHFSAVTGLAYKAECSFSKLLWLKGEGLSIAPGSTWLNALEYVAFRLTGVRATEPSLASRTGLFDQSELAAWGDSLAFVSAPEELIPQLVSAGASIGHVSESAPPVLRGAAVTIAGHDHLVGAVGAGASGIDDLYNSCGTADVVVRTMPRLLTNAERADLVGEGLSAGQHVINGATAILGATRSGLVLGRVLAMLGASDLVDRRAITEAWQGRAGTATNVVIDEPAGWTNEVTVRLHDSATPGEVWGAAMEYTLSKTETLLGAIEKTAGPYVNAVAAGGWSRLPGVFRGKADLMPGLRFSAVDEAGARGAALFAATAAGSEIDAWQQLVALLPTTDEENKR